MAFSVAITAEETTNEQNGHERQASTDSLGNISKIKPVTRLSKKQERYLKKVQSKYRKSSRTGPGLLGLPFDVLIIILEFCPPSAIFRLLRTSHSFRDLILEHQQRIARHIISFRYAVLTQCLRLPVLLTQVDKNLHDALRDRRRHPKNGIHWITYQHVKPPDNELICTCLTCHLRWNALCLIVDFAFWQETLERYDAIPVIPRGQHPAWNEELIKQHAGIVTRALQSPLLYAAILEAHLTSTVAAIKRQARNRGNQRRHFQMSEEEARSGTDAFLGKGGPSSVDFPFARDNYYLLEVYAPNRGWRSSKGEDKGGAEGDGSWGYMGEGMHDLDLGFVRKWMEEERERSRANEAISASQANAERTGRQSRQLAASDSTAAASEDPKGEISDVEAIVGTEQGAILHSSGAGNLDSILENTVEEKDALTAAVERGLIEGMAVTSLFNQPE